MKFDVSGIDSSGNSYSLVVDADDKDSARKIMEEKGIYNSVIKPYRKPRRKRTLSEIKIDGDMVLGFAVMLGLFVLCIYGFYRFIIFMYSPSDNYSSPAPTQQYTSQEEQDARDALSRQGFEGEELEKILDLSKKMQKLQNEGK